MVPVGAIDPIFSVSIVIPAAGCLRLIGDTAEYAANPSDDVWDCPGFVDRSIGVTP